MQNCIHFALLSFVVSIYWVQRHPESYFFRLIQIALLVICQLSFSASIGFTAGLLTIYCLQIFFTKNSYLRQNLFSLAGLVAVLIGSLIFLVSKSHSTGFSLIGFLHHYLSLWTLALTQSNFSPQLVYLPLDLFLFLGTLCLMLRYLLIDRLQSLQKHYGLIALFVGVSLALAAISLGRHSYGASQGKSYRYSEIAFLIFPMIAFWIQDLVKKHRRMKWPVILLLIVLISDDFHYENYKADHLEHRYQGINCLREGFKENSGFNCPRIYHQPLDPFISQLEPLKLEFLETLKPNQ
jgi:hypothetical protein